MFYIMRNGNNLRNIEDKILQFQCRTSIPKWTQVGDRVNKMFFSPVAPKWLAVRIKKSDKRRWLFNRRRVGKGRKQLSMVNCCLGVVTDFVHTSTKRVWDKIVCELRMKVALK